MKFSSELKTDNNHERTRKGSLVVLLTLQRGPVSNHSEAGPFLFFVGQAPRLPNWQPEWLPYRKLKAEY